MIPNSSCPPWKTSNARRAAPRRPHHAQDLPRSRRRPRLLQQRLLERTVRAITYFGSNVSRILALLPPIAVIVLMQRWFVAGLTEGEK
jgi:hypothetical protein